MLPWLADRSIFELLPRAVVLADEPESLKREFDHVWSRIDELMNAAGVGNLVRPSDLYLSSRRLVAETRNLPGADVEHLGISRPNESEPYQLP